MTAPIFNVLIIGAGAIGALYDTPESEYMLTHAHAFSAHNGFNLSGFVDSDHERGQNAARTWKCRAFKTIEEAFESEKVDIVCIAVPDELHYELLKKVALYPVKTVFTEKPLTRTAAEANEIVALYNSLAIPVCVNYKRSFVPEFEVLRDRIRAAAFGKYLIGAGYYGKGFLHNGSHLVHLLRELIGEIRHHDTDAGENDFYDDDPSISATISFNDKALFHMNHINCRLYTIFEADLFFERGRVRITDAGFKIEYHAPLEHPIFKDYDFLTKTEEVNTDLGRSLYYSASNIYNHLTAKEPLKCTARDAFKTMLVCDQIQSGLRTGPEKRVTNVNTSI